MGVEFCGTSITSRSGWQRQDASVLAENPHFVFADAERKGYGIVDLTPQQMSVSLRVVSDVAAKEATIETLAKFAVQAGRAKIERG